ncbi:hypothetical protein [Candidimonas nitroreducens]|uniref:Uncharacterized protein n=1 Tax=Candidimonas nitroreducens TaxID=683354 RepID=A0A225MPZ9_9BURK|nr:hypothetical protein [Candidimonas nitroreducens]OWT62000.1 hypothetical protein CEY11_09325 [Candidimonas nitroreducens]
MDAAPHPADNRPMDHEQLFSEAVRLAYQTFEDATDEHITGVFAVLAWYAQRGQHVDALVVH